MTVLEVNNLNDLQEIIANNQKVVVDFAGKTWCQPCIRFAPHFAAASEKLPDTVFVEVDIDQAGKETTDTFGVMSVPTVLDYRNGTLFQTIKSRTVVPLVKELS